MTEALTTTDGSSLDYLLAHVTAVCDQTIAEIERDSAAACAALQQSVDLKIRSVLQEAKQAERRRAQTQVNAARAAARGRLRQRRQAERADLLASLWPRLVEAVQERWQDADGRRDWTQMALTEAGDRLPVGHWSVRFDAASATQDWCEAVESWGRQVPGLSIALTPVAELGPGLRIVCGCAVLDATVSGLLSRRARVAGGLLHALGEGLNLDDGDKR